MILLQTGDCGSDELPSSTVTLLSGNPSISVMPCAITGNRPYPCQRWRRQPPHGPQAVSTIRIGFAPAMFPNACCHARTHQLGASRIQRGSEVAHLLTEGTRAPAIIAVLAAEGRPL